MEENHDPRRCPLEDLDPDGRSVDADRHRLAKLVPLLLERVPDQPVQDPDQRRAAWRLGQKLRVPPTDDRLERAAAQTRAVPESAIDGARDRVMGELHGARGRSNAVERALGDRKVERLDAMRRGRELVDAEPDKRLGLRHGRKPTSPSR